MAPGRKRKAPELHVVDGTYRKDRHGADAPPPSSEAPVAPADLTARERLHFDEVVKRHDELGLASASYTQTYSLVAARRVEIEDANKAIRKHGLVYETVNEAGEMLVKPNPAVRMRSEAQRHIHSLMSELGLTPAARSKVGSGKTKKRADGWDSL